MRLSEIMRGEHTYECGNCQHLHNGKCVITGKDVSWFVENHRKPKDCKSHRRNLR